MTAPCGARARRALVALFVCMVVAGPELAADDRDLLWRGRARPYVFLLLDNSGSMTLDPAGEWLTQSGDDPGSRLQIAKRALYEVLREVQGIHLGFATLNQDRLRVRAKHWLYRVEPEGGVLSIAYPAAGSLLTVGDSVGASTEGAAGSCLSPLSLDEHRLAIDRFPKLGAAGDRVVTHWVRDEGRTYRLQASPTTPTARPGAETLVVEWSLQPVERCEPLFLGPTETRRTRLRRAAEFLLRDRVQATAEPGAGPWLGTDVLSESSCDPGKGWESNWDSELDRYCSSRNGACTHLLQPTLRNLIDPALDVGDVIPLDWSEDNNELVLDRLAPNRRAASSAELRAAPYFADRVEPGLLHLDLQDSNRRPILSSVERSPLGRAILDFSCWLSASRPETCGVPAPRSWSAIAAEHDITWACRRLYLVLITDGDVDCSGSDPCGTFASVAAAAGVRTSILELTRGSETRPLCTGRAGVEESLRVDDLPSMKTALGGLLRRIRAEDEGELVGTFAASHSGHLDTAFVTSFDPIVGSSRWRGRVEAFRRPIPRLADGAPDRRSPAFLWDAGEALRSQAPTRRDALAGRLALGAAPDQRRVFYSQLSAERGPVRPGEWPDRRRLLSWTSPATDEAARHDLWTGLGLERSEESGEIERRANRIISETLALREIEAGEAKGATFVLGDSFHSRPLVVAAPIAHELHLADLEGNGAPCSEGNPGYRCFAQKHRHRRRVLLIGGNDGMLHIFDAGLARSEPSGPSQPIGYDPGTGRELAAYVPRRALRTLREQAETDAAHRYGVDGTPVAADAFIDPSFSGRPRPADREFRTVAIVGLREGGPGYLALDITQPDLLDAQQRARPGPASLPSCLGDGPTLRPFTPEACGPTPWPSPLWEFLDGEIDLATGLWIRLDEDANGHPDLGESWSTPTIGRIRLCEAVSCRAGGTGLRDFWVAIFGGGYDPGGHAGNWIYMVDIETGSAIYKRRVSGSIAGGVSAVDVDHDGYLDRLYAGTLDGRIYRVDLAAGPSGVPPRLTPARAGALQPTGGRIEVSTLRVAETGPDGEPQWEPRPIFDTRAPDAGPRPIFHRPLLIQVDALDAFALAFGTGDRSDLRSRAQQGQYFYVFVDDDSDSDPVAPRSVEALRIITPDAGSLDLDLIRDRPVGSRGWALVLDPGERVMAPAFAVSGLTAFTTFRPEASISEESPPHCTLEGESRLFAVDTTNGNGLLAAGGSSAQRYLTWPGVVGDLFTDPVPSESTEEGTPSEPISEEQRGLMKRLESLQPQECRFASYRVDLKASLAGGREIPLAPIPICMIQRAWREH